MAFASLGRRLEAQDDVVILARDTDMMGLRTTPTQGSRDGRTRVPRVARMCRRTDGAGVLTRCRTASTAPPIWRTPAGTPPIRRSGTTTGRCGARPAGAKAGP